MDFSQSHFYRPHAWLITIGPQKIQKWHKKKKGNKEMKNKNTKIKWDL